jgi:hypothetical protein
MVESDPSGGKHFHYIEHEWCITINYVKEEHFYTLAYLDVVPGHNDSTDRMIIAQAYGTSPADQFRPDVRTLPQTKPRLYLQPSLTGM